MPDNSVRALRPSTLREHAELRKHTGAWTGAYVSYDGLAMPCCMIATPDRMNMGSMAADGVRDVWNNLIYETFRLQLDSAEPPEICQRCSVYHWTF